MLMKMTWISDFITFKLNLTQEATFNWTSEDIE